MITRDRLRLADFSPLPDELEVARQLDALRVRFVTDDSGHIVKLWADSELLDHHIHLVVGLPKLWYFMASNHPPSAAGISDTGMLGLLAHVSLANVVCQGNHRLTGVFLSALQESSISHLAVPYCSVDDAGLSHSRDCTLTHLSLRGTLVSDASIDTLCSMRALTQLHVAETRLSQSGAEAVRNALPDCWIDILQDTGG